MRLVHLNKARGGIISAWREKFKCANMEYYRKKLLHFEFSMARRELLEKKNQKIKKVKKVSKNEN